MDIAVLGIDLGKTVCSLAGLDATGAVVFRKRLQRFRLLDFLAALSPCVVAMEACGGAHHIGRFCLEQGHEPRLMSPLYVRPYVKVHKTDDRDAEGIAEAATRPTMSFVTIKSEEQLDLQALDRARERLVRNRTRLINQARGLLMERGIRIGTGRHVFQNAVRKIIEDPAVDLSPRILLLIEDMIASALVAAIGDGRTFAKARDLSAWLGLVPRQLTTGGKARMIGISKQGNSYLRKLFIHGARTVLYLVKDRETPLARWIDQLKERSHGNVAAVAMANKLVRIAWAVLTKKTNFRQSALIGA